MNIPEWLDKPENSLLLMQGAAGLMAIVLVIMLFKRARRVRKQREEAAQETAQVKANNQALAQEIRDRLVENIRMFSRVIKLNPIIPGNTPDDSTLEGRNRAKCLALIIEGLPLDLKGKGI